MTVQIIRVVEEKRMKLQLLLLLLLQEINIEEVAVKLIWLKVGEVEKEMEEIVAVILVVLVVLVEVDVHIGKKEINIKEKKTLNLDRRW